MLDLGAGGGILTRALADAGAHVRAVEVDSVALRELHARFGADPRVEVVEASRTFRSPRAPRSCAASSATRWCR